MCSHVDGRVLFLHVSPALLTVCDAFDRVVGVLLPPPRIPMINYKLILILQPLHVSMDHYKILINLLQLSIVQKEHP